MPAKDHSSLRTKQPRTEKQLETSPVHCLVKNTVCQPTPQVEANRLYQLDAILPFIKKGIVAPVHAGRVQFFTHNWAQITQDPWVLQTIKGLCLPFTAFPVQEVAPAEMRFPTEQEELISVEVQTLVQKGAIYLLKDHQVSFVSQLFLVPKKDGGFRPVVNLKTLNKYILEEHFKMEGFHMVRDLVRQGDWLTTIDLKDVYFLILVYPCHQKFLLFTWKERLYQFQCLPFGLSCAPRVFTKVIKPVVAFLRERGIKLIIYLDDLLIISSCPEILSVQINLIRDLFQILGLIINETKSQMTPTQEVVFLGFHLFISKMTISLPQEKMKRIKQDAVHLLQKPLVSIQEMATFVGKTTAASQAIRVAPLFHRQLQALINSVISQAQLKVEVQQAYHQKIALTTEAWAEFQWWAQKASAQNQAPVAAQLLYQI